MATIQILTTDTNTQRETKIAAAVGGDFVEFQDGTHNWNAGESNRLMGTSSGGTAITYRPEGPLGCILRKVSSTRTEPIFRDQNNNASANVHHKVIIDGRDGSSGTTPLMTFDGAGIFVESSFQQNHSGWEIKYCIMKNFQTGANQQGGRGYWWLNTCNMPGLNIHHNEPEESIQAGKEGYWLFIHVYNDMDDIKVHHNTLTNVYQGFNITSHVLNSANAPTGFEFHHNVHDGVWRAFIEHLGIGAWYINPMFYFNKCSRWFSNSTTPLDTYGLSLVDNRAYGQQCFGNVCDGGRVAMVVNNPGTSGIPVGTITFVRIGNESSAYFSYDFGNLYTGNEVGWYATGGGGQYCYGNTFALQRVADIQIAGWVGTAEFAAAGKPVFNVTRAAAAGTEATATVVVAAGKVTQVTVAVNQTNYKKQLDAGIATFAVCPPKVTIAGDGTGAKVLAWVDPATYGIAGFVILNQGSGYTAATATIAKAATSEPNTFAANGNSDYPIESGGAPPTPTVIPKATPTDGVFLSDNTGDWLQSDNSFNGLGPFELDQTNQSELPGDGNELGIGSNPPYSYLKGIGCHAPAVIEVKLENLNAVRFKAEVGIACAAASPGEVAVGSGSVNFQIIKDNENNVPVVDTGLLVSGNQPRELDVDITGWTRMFLMINSNGDNTLDSFCLAHARIVRTSVPGGTKKITCANVDLANHVLTKLYDDNTTETETTI